MQPNILMTVDKNIKYLFTSARHTDVECRVHMHSTLEIVLVEEGVLDMWVSGRKYRIKKGYGIFISEFEPHSFHSEEHNICHVLMFSKKIVPFFADYLTKNSVSRHIFAVPDSSIKIAQQILPSSKNSVNHIYAQAVLSLICKDAYDGCAFEKKQTADNGILLSALSYMEEHFEDNINLNTVAKEIGVHPVTLSKLFSKQTTVNFTYYLQYLRCSHAANLIKSEDCTLSEIGLRSGFGSIRSFNRAFLNIFETTPSEYRHSLLI